MRLVVENSEVTLAFREHAANVMRFVAGDQDVDLYNSMAKCLAHLDPDGGLVNIVDFTPQRGDQDEAINMIIQGVLKMVAGTLATMDTEGDEYQAGLSTLSHGVIELNRKLQTARRERIVG